MGIAANSYSPDIRPQRRRLMLLPVAFATMLTLAASPAFAADALNKGTAAYKTYAAENIDASLAGAKAILAAIKSGNATAAKAAWIKSRSGWEKVEPITGEFFADLDQSIDAWPDAKQGYHAIEAPLFAGKLDVLSVPAEKLVADLAAFDARLRAPGFAFGAQGLLNGATKLAYEVAENKSKGGESPYAGTSLNDMRDNVDGIKAVYTLVFKSALTRSDAKLAHRVQARFAVVETILGAKDLKSLDEPALRKNGEELAVLLQKSAGKLALKKPALGE